MQGEPAPAPLDEPGERGPLFRTGPDVAGVGDQQVGPVEVGDTVVVLVHGGAHARMLTEQFQQPQPRVVEVVPASAADEHGVQRPAGPATAQYWTRVSSPPSTARLTPTTKEPVRPSRNATAAATSSAVP